MAQSPSSSTRTKKGDEKSSPPSNDVKPPSVTRDRKPVDWAKFFESNAEPDTVRELVAELVATKKFEEAISCIEQAILHGQIQPWMHEVLALAMQAAGRPKAQIERALLSSHDLISNDPISLMTLAAYLVQFGRTDRALELYRQAAALDPSRPEPFILGLELAMRTKDYSAVVWSAPEVLSYSWTKGRESLNRLAEDAASEAEAVLIKSGDTTRALELRVAMNHARRVDLSVRLEWNGQGDLDMQIVEPGGTTCSMAKPMTSGGGTFTHDGYGPNQANCYEEYLCPQAFPGEYRVIVSHVSGNIVGKRARLQIIRDRGADRESTITETIFLGPVDQTIRFSVSDGRRRIANENRETSDANDGPKTNRQSSHVLAQLGGGQGAVGQVVPVVGPNAVGFTPIVSFINEGVQMGAMAVVSGDRRYVRINAQPAFTTITDVFSFTFSR